MGIHDVDRAPLLVGAKLEDVSYSRSDQIAEYDTWDGKDAVEDVVLRANGQHFTIWVSEGVVDTLAIAGEVTEVNSSPLVNLPAADRAPWNEVVGATITRVRTATTAANEPKPRKSSSPMTQALELTFDSGQVITLAGCNPDLGLSTTWFDDVAVLACALESLPDFDQRTVTVH